jgi:hypothetical protein
MAGLVMQPLGRDGAMKPRTADGRSTRKLAAGFIKPNDRLTSFERLAIYNRQYWLRFKDCFYEDYPGLRAILGERRFERLAGEYLARHPSRSFTLRNLGRYLVKFLEANPRWAAPRRQLVLDMARLEWAHIEAFDNEAKPPLQPDALLRPDAAQIRLKLQPHITLLRLHYELDDFLIKLKHGAGLRAEASNAMARQRKRWHSGLTRSLKPRTIYLAVHRHSDSVYNKRLQPAQYRLLRAFQSNTTLEDACACLENGSRDAATHIKEWFEDWASLGWFCDLD